MFAKFAVQLRQQYLGALALFIVLGGTSYAVAKNSIGSAQIRNNSVRSKDIRNNDISSRDVKNRSLVAADFKASAAPVGPRGPQGTPGPSGSARAYGEIRADSPTGVYELVPGRSKNVITVTQAPAGATAACIRLAPSIDATTASILATPNARQGQFVEFDTLVFVARPLANCAGVLDPAHTIEVITTKAPNTGVAKRPFFFAVM
jgi:hypothetical protein